MAKRRIHDLRRSFATYYLTSGINPLWVSQQLGHHNPSFTLAVYGHLIPDANENAVDRLLRTR